MINMKLNCTMQRYYVHEDYPRKDFKLYVRICSNPKLKFLIVVLLIIQIPCQFFYKSVYISN